MLKSKLLKRMRSDRADSTLVTFVLVMPLFFMFVVTMIDTSIYFANRAIIQQVARDGARQVAIFGGDGTATTRSPLEASYGDSGTCAEVSNATGRTANKTEIECKILQRYDQGSGLTNVIVDRVDCGPDTTLAIGQTTFCNVDWTYGGIPGAVTNFFKTREGESPFHTNQTRVTGQSEVNMTGIAPVTR